MKRILIALAVLLAVQVADAQVKTPEAARKAVEAAKVASENPKKAVKVATWTKLAKAYMDAYDAPSGNLLINTPRIQLEQMMALKKPLSAEEVMIDGMPFRKEYHESVILYFDSSDMLRMIEVTKPVYEDPLAGALEAYVKAAEVDVKGSKIKDIQAGIAAIAAKYFDDGMNKYTLGDMGAAASLIGKAANASETAPLSKSDTTYLYYAGYINMQNENYEEAKNYLNRCREIGYYAEGGNLFPALGDVYMKLGDEDTGIKVLEEGFAMFPENANLLVGLINYYLPKEGGESQLLGLIEKAKKAMPDNASIFRVEGDIHKRLGDYENAERAYRESMAIAPDSADPHIALGGYFIDRGNEYFNKAQETFNEAEYQALMAQYDDMCIAALAELEIAFGLMPESDFKKDIANTIKSICFVLRNKDAQYQEKYDQYIAYINQ